MSNYDTDVFMPIFDAIQKARSESLIQLHEKKVIIWVTIFGQNINSSFVVSVLLSNICRQLELGPIVEKLDQMMWTTWTWLTGLLLIILELFQLPLLMGLVQVSTIEKIRCLVR